MHVVEYVTVSIVTVYTVTRIADAPYTVQVSIR